MNECIKTLSQDVKVVSTTTFQNLTIVFMNYQKNNYDFISAKEAFSKNLLSIHEHTIENVESLFAVNNSDYPVLLLRGMLLKGGAQNRVLNSSILLKGKNKINIPVNCVEQFRWQTRRSHHSNPLDLSGANKGSDFNFDGFMTRRITKTMDDQRYKNFLHFSNALPNQGEIWKNIDSFLSETNQRNSTNDFVTARQKIKYSVQDYLNAFKNLPNEINAIGVFTYDKMLGFELISHPPVFKDYYHELIEGYIHEVIYIKERKEHDIAKYQYLALDTLDQLSTKKYQTKQGIDMGNDILGSDDVSFSGIELNGQIIQLSILN